MLLLTEVEIDLPNHRPHESGAADELKKLIPGVPELALVPDDLIIGKNGRGLIEVHIVFAATADWIKVNKVHLRTEPLILWIQDNPAFFADIGQSQGH